MEIKNLEYLRAIASAGSLTAAAKALGLTQPTLTAAIRQLERGWKTTLFLRDRSGMTPTQSGAVLIDYATQVLEATKRAREAIANLEHQPVGRFVLGCHEALGSYFLPAFLPTFVDGAPQISLMLWAGSSSDVTQAVVDRRVDFGLAVNPRPHLDLVITPLFNDAMDFFVRRDARPLDAVKARERLSRGPLFFAGRITQCQQLLDQLAAQSLLPLAQFDLGDLGLVKSLALTGMGVAMLPRRVAAFPDPTALERLDEELPFIPDTIALLHRADAHKTKAHQLLKQALVAHGRLLARQG